MLAVAPVLDRLGAPAQAAETLVDVTEVVVSAFAAFLFARYSRRVRNPGNRERTAAGADLGWVLFSAACASWCIGQTIWTVYTDLLQRDLPSPSGADVAYLGFAALAPAATLVVTRAGLRPLSRIRAILDGLIVAGGLLVVSWMLILRGVFASGTGSSLQLIVNLGSPLGDVLILSVVVLVISRTRLSAGLALLTGGAGLMAVSDSAYTYVNSKGEFSVGGLMDAGWTAAFVLLALAARADLPAPATLRRSAGGPIGLLVPYAPLLASGGFLLASEIQGIADAQALAGSAVLVLVVLARQGLLVLENHQLVRQLRVMAYTDPLTGVANRLGFTERLEEVVATGRPLTVAFCDLDSFKAVNDHCGHAVGDALLVAVAARLTAAVREADVVARLGGDEFAVLTSGDDAGDVAQTLRDRLCEALAVPFSLAPEVIAVMGPAADTDVLDRAAVSLGVVSSAEVAGGSAELVIQLADQRMYAAKRERKASAGAMASRSRVLTSP